MVKPSSWRGADPLFMLTLGYITKGTRVKA
jgi:hypothetical protein